MSSLFLSSQIYFFFLDFTIFLDISSCFLNKVLIVSRKCTMNENNEQRVVF